MSPPLLGVEGVGQSNVCLMDSSLSMDSVSPTGLGLKERNYLGFSECSSVDSSAVTKENKSNLNLKATELRLGLPGSQSPERDPEFKLLCSGKLDEKPLFPLLPSKDGICSSSQKTVVTGNKRGFSDAMNGFSEIKGSSFTEGNWMFRSDSETPKSTGHGKVSGSANMNVMLSSGPAGTHASVTKEVPLKVSQEGHNPKTGITNKMNGSSNNCTAPAAKAQVVGWPPIRSFRKNTLATSSKNNEVGWPPIRSFRKNTLATSSKNNEEVDGKPGPGTLYVKVSMDGAPYLRKVDLRTYSTYPELSSALEKMFSCFTIGQCGSQSNSGREMLSESKLRDLLHGSEYVLTYEDKDGDWMLVGDVPWEMFIESCKRLKIMKGSDAIGLAPRAMEKSKNRR